MKLFQQQFHCFGGRYSVRTKPETIKGVYSFTRKFPELSKSAIDEIIKEYGPDAFKGRRKNIAEIKLRRLVQQKKNKLLFIIKSLSTKFCPLIIHILIIKNFNKPFRSKYYKFIRISKSYLIN